MSLKESLGLRSHKEDPKMFWFEMTLLCLLLSAAGWLLSLLKLSGIVGTILKIAGPLFLSWALVCAVLTESVDYRKKNPVPYSQRQLENGILTLTAVLALLDRLLRLFPHDGNPMPVVIAGVAVYFFVRISVPRLRVKHGRMTSKELTLVLICGVLAWIILLPFIDMAVTVISAL